MSILEDFLICEFRAESINPDDQPLDQTPTKTSNNDIRPEERRSDQNFHSYSGLHIFMFLLSFYVMASVTNWYQVDTVDNYVTYKTSTVAMLLLMCATFLCLWVFTWILVKPVLSGFINRFTEQIIDNRKMTSDRETGLPGSETKSTGIVTSSLKNESDNEERTEKDLIPVDSEAIDNRWSPDPGIAVEKEVKNIKDGDSMSKNEEEMIRLQEKVLKLQEKIGRLQYKVAVLQGVNL